MKKVSLLVLSAAVAVSALFAFVVATEARPPYKKEWDAKYLKMVPAAAEAKCNVCHVGEKKKDRNVYGQALAKLLTKDDVKDVPKIQQALDTVAAMPSDPNDPKSPTFGELMKNGKLPGGPAK